MTTSMIFQRTSLAAIRAATRRLALGAVLAVLGVPAMFAAAPANDSFAAQPVLVGSTNSVSVSSLGATAEAGEPSHYAGNPASASVWWTWIAPDNGVAVVDTLGSSFDTVLAVYTGDAVNALSLVANNDDAPLLATSLLSFPAVRGTKYRIAVDGFSGLSGDARLRIRLPVAPSAPNITGQPVSQTVSETPGSNVTFSVTATGSYPLVFQWQKGGVNLVGATSSSVTFSNATLAAAGNYRVVITNSSGSATSSVAVLNVLTTPGQDMFAGRVVISGQSGSVVGHNYGATLEAGEPLHAGVTNGGSVWWTWTAPQNGLVQLDTAGSSFDTVLAVYTGAAVNSLASVAANNDEIPGQLSTSKVFFRAVAGVVYHFAVAGLTGNGTAAVGDIALNLAQSPDNDFFANALVFAPNLTRIQDNNTGATREPGEPSHPGNPGGSSVWWKWIAPSNGTYVVSTVGSAVETVLGIYTGNSVATLVILGVDDSTSEDDAASIKFFATGGKTYSFSVAGYSGTNGVAQGAIVLNLNPSLVLNDAFAERVTLSAQTNRVIGSNLGATKEAGEPDHGANAGGRSVWWSWTAQIDGPVVVTTRDSDFDTVLAVYGGTSLGSLTLIAENDDSDPINPAAGSVVVFPGVAGQTYQIAVDGYRNGAGTVAAGNIQLTLAQINPDVLGANDLFVNRVAITGRSNQVFQTSANASDEVGEPNHAGNDGGKSLWWSWVAPATAPVRIDTIGSAFDTLLGVYQGTNVGALAVVGSDDESGGNGASIVFFEAVAGVEYQIAVDGFNNGAGAASGRVVLNLYQFASGALHANDDFDQASPISEPFLTVNASNIGATRQPGEPAHGTAQTGHSVWWTWTAQNNGPVTISTTGSQFDTVLGVYTGAALNALSLVAENDDIDPGHLQSRVTFQASAGTVYHIAVDGYGNKIGFITLTVAPGGAAQTAPQIQQAPADQTRFSNGGGGTNASFRVVATGSSPRSYQWLRNNSPVAGATNDLLTVANVTALNAGTYRVVVSNAFGTATSAAAELTLLATPFNDDFANRSAITGTSNVVRGSILGATKELNEPRHGAETGGRSVWWKWTAPANGPVELHTLGSSFDTVLGVYTGNAVGSLTLVAENDDMVELTVFSSRVLFTAVAGQEYQIAVDGFKTNNTAGSVVLALRQSPPPLIVVQPSGLNLVHSTNPAFALAVVLSGPAPSTGYQWTYAGNAIPGATNSTYAFGALSRTNSGAYAVTITNRFGSVTSSNADLRVLVSQRMLAPQRLLNGRVRILFSDPDGTLASDPSRFEVQHTTNLGAPVPIWTINSGPITPSSGRYLFEDQTSGADSLRFYRIVEKNP